MTQALSFEFLTAGQIQFGRGKLGAGLAPQIVTFGAPVMVITGGSGLRHAGTRALVDALAPVLQIAIAAEPDLKTIEGAAMRARGAGVACVVAIGGGWR